MIPPVRWLRLCRAALDRGIAFRDLAWKDNSNNETGFKVFRATSQNGTYSLIATTSVNATSYADTRLSRSTTYWYKVLATNSAGDSGPAGPVGSTTLPR